MSNVYSIQFENEQALAAAIAGGDHKAFTVLFEKCYNVVYSYAMKICQSEPLSEEVVQDVLMKVWINRANLPQIQNLGGYILVMTRNQTLQVLKRIAFETQCATIKNMDWTEFDKETENYINYKETKVLLDKAVAALPSQQKLVYNLCQLQGIKQQEVASRLRISHLTVKAHLRQAVKTVRAIVLSNSGFALFLLVYQLFNRK